MQKKDYLSIATDYAVGVTTGTTPACSWVKMAAQRFLDDLKAEKDTAFPYRMDAAKASKVCKFTELLPHIKGPLAGEKITLEPWQIWILVTVYGFVWKAGPRKDMRRFRRVYIEVPRGNGKSAISSGTALYMLAADGEGGAEVYSAAVTRAQAKIVAETSQHMARKSPELSKALGIEVHAHTITVQRTASKMEALAADADSLDGKNVHYGVIDELHAHKTREVYDALETGTGKRPQSLLWVITTAGVNRAGICYEVRTYITKILKGVTKDDSTFGVIYTIDDDDDWTSEEAHRKANPNYNISVMPEVVGQLCSKAMAMPAATNNFKTKHLNIWSNADSSWMDMRAWDRCGDPGLDIADFQGEQCWIGIDLASRTDIAAICRLFVREIDGIRHYYVFSSFFLPHEAVIDGRNSQYSGWEIAGRLNVTHGNTLDFSIIRDVLLDDSSRFEVRDIAYDPWQATQLAQELQANGATVTEYRNNTGNFSAPMKEVDALVRSGRLHHDDDPVMTWMISNVVCHVDNKDNIYPRKERPENKIDGVIALITALGRCIASEQSGSLDNYLNNMIMAGVD